MSGARTKLESFRGRGRENKIDRDIARSEEGREGENRERERERDRERERERERAES